mmetsp:Transcript_54894/g.146812  ORF Transcript_54894/g.146812 Transcript_54894/m.146812 type:complete len:254 (+) Transcript_54894:6404-7165(+)
MLRCNVADHALQRRLGPICQHNGRSRQRPLTSLPRAGEANDHRLQPGSCERLAELVSESSAIVHNQHRAPPKLHLALCRQRDRLGGGVRQGHLASRSFGILCSLVNWVVHGGLLNDPCDRSTELSCARCRSSGCRSLQVSEFLLQGSLVALSFFGLCAGLLHFLLQLRQLCAGLLHDLARDGVTIVHDRVALLDGARRHKCRSAQLQGHSLSLARRFCCLDDVGVRHAPWVETVELNTVHRQLYSSLPELQVC